MKTLEKQLTERFYRYLAVSSQSDGGITSLPSTSGQQKLAELLAKELSALGLQEIKIDQYATVTAVKPGTKKGGPRIGFITHIDTVDVGLSPHIHPQILTFTGEDVCLNKKENIWLRVSEHPEILPYKDQEIIFSDGTSVLGADNKAAVTVVMTLLENLREDQEYGDIVVAFVPDEEIGLLGAKALDLSRFNVDFAYTIDCCELGEVVYENFNAATADVTFTGVTAHPMSAKGVLVNPILMAQDFISHFDRSETPENTAGREGYIWFNGMNATQQEGKLTASIRDFDLQSFAARKKKIEEAVQIVAAKYPTAQVSLKITDTYSNISSAIGEDRRAIDLIFAGLKEIGVEPKVIPMRGGTDGAALSAKGILTPNYFTGALNFHSIDLQSFAARKKKIEEAVQIVAAKYPTAQVSLKITDTYSNISSAIGEDRRAIDLIFAGLKEIGVEPKVIPMRGGTDGAALSAKGILTPNYFTGALNFHSKYEFLPLASFVKSYELTEQICLLAAKK